MQNLKKLLTTARTTEADTVSSGIITEFEKNDWSWDAHLTGIFGLLKSENIQLSKAIKRMKAESDLEEKDEQRDNKVRAINYIVIGFIHHSDSAISSAAEKVNTVFEHYGIDIIYESYASETSLIKSLLTDFAVPDIQTAITALPGLSQMVVDLRTAQTAFEAAQLLFQNEKAAEGSEENATELKKKVISVINDKLVVYLNAMIQVNEAKYGAFSGTVAQIINDMNEIVKKRRKVKDTANIEFTQS